MLPRQYTTLATPPHTHTHPHPHTRQAIYYSQLSSFMLQSLIMSGHPLPQRPLTDQAYGACGEAPHNRSHFDALMALMALLWPPSL